MSLLGTISNSHNEPLERYSGIPIQNSPFKNDKYWQVEIFTQVTVTFSKMHCKLGVYIFKKNWGPIGASPGNLTCPRRFYYYP